MATTRLSVTALPGKPHSFVAKTAAGGTHTGNFTALSVTATPGSRHTFSAKTTSGAGTHTGNFTRLSVMALPGPIRSFLAKTEAPVATVPKIVTLPDLGGGGQSDEWYPEFEKRYDVHKDDQEVMEIIIEMLMSGILH